MGRMLSGPNPLKSILTIMTFIEKLQASWQTSRSLVCVGLDPEVTKLPDCVRGEPKPLLAFNRAIIDATADLVCAFKPQAAYYHAVGAEDELAQTIAYIRKQYPQVPVILDAKRGDIGPTADQYVREAFDRYDADAVTVNPYMGGDTLQPFLARTDRGVIVLCRTSNPGSGDFQNLQLADGRKLYQAVADKAAKEWNRSGNVALVVGATFPDELADVSHRVGDMPLLVPGIGAQGGDLAQTVQNGADSKGTGMMISSSRAILYASSGADFADAARQVVLTLRKQINAYRMPLSAKRKA